MFSIVAIAFSIITLAIVVAIFVIISICSAFGTAECNADNRTPGTLQLADRITNHCLWRFSCADNQQCAITQRANLFSIRYQIQWWSINKRITIIFIQFFKCTFQFLSFEKHGRVNNIFFIRKEISRSTGAFSMAKQ